MFFGAIRITREDRPRRARDTGVEVANVTPLDLPDFLIYDRIEFEICIGYGG